MVEKLFIRNQDDLSQRRRDAEVLQDDIPFSASLRLCEKKTIPSVIPRSRHGTTMTELLVAATLLISAMAFAGPLAVRSGRLQQDARHYQAALEELSNQLERLTALDNKKRETELVDLTPSMEAQAALPNPQLSAETMDDAEGLRLVMQIQWDRPGEAKPLTLVGWIEPPPIPEEEP